MRIHFIFKYCLLICLFSLNGKMVFAQANNDTTINNNRKQKNWSLNGYIKDLQTVSFGNIKDVWQQDNVIHNRFDFRWYPLKNLIFNLGLRNRLIYGDMVPYYEQNESLLNSGSEYFNLSKVISSGKSYLIHSTFDRANIDYTYKKWEFTLGRQRINWGQNLVWNPNDIFNAYSYFDFDYEERPGTDAVRIQYYLNSTSSAEIAYKPGKNIDETIAAGLYRFNKYNYDFQLLLGSMNTDYVAGAGWSGALGQVGFNGEISAFVPHQNTALSGVVVSASTGINYTFKNSLYTHVAYLFNSAGVWKPDSVSQLFSVLTPLSAKTLSPSRHSLFGELAYQFTPLIRGDVSSIVDIGDGSYFLAPFLTISVTNNISFLAGGQLFFGNNHSIYGSIDQRSIIFRIKASF